MDLYPRQDTVELVDLQITPPGWLESFVANYQPDPKLGKRLPVPDLAFDTPEACMQFAIDLSAKNVGEKTGGPFGTGIFAHEEQTGVYMLLSSGVNRVVSNNASRGHGENLALEAASRKLGVSDLSESEPAKNGQKIVLFTNGETCAQCMDHCCASKVSKIMAAAKGADIERLTGFWEGVKPSDWRDQLAKRGIETGSLLSENAIPVLEEYARVGLIYNASAAADEPEHQPKDDSEEPEKKPENAIHLPAWVNEYLKQWKNEPHSLSPGTEPKVLATEEIQQLFSTPEGRMQFVTDLGQEAVQHGLPPIGAAVFVKAPGEAAGFDVMSVGVHLVQAEHSTSLTAPVVAASQAERLVGTFALPADRDPIVATTVISGYDLGALSWAGPSRIEYGVSMDQVPAEHPVREVLTEGLNTPTAYAKAVAELKALGELPPGQEPPALAQVNEVGVRKALDIGMCVASL